MLQYGADLCVNQGDTLREHQASLADEERGKKGNSFYLCLVQDIDNHLHIIIPVENHM